jgi:hypothetical protein
MKISEWVKTEEALDIENKYKKWGLLDKDSSWDKFLFTESNRLYETYELPESSTWLDSATIKKKLDNVVYVDSYAISNVWMSLRVAAEAIKLEGCEVGEGKLIVQERLERWTAPPSSSDCWYGAIDQVGRGMILISTH